ncbi:methyltransferase [Crossiella sp. CA-258035]|uniref:methyltransferase n=1 Tax=Crossiella sp. CA-258035 TaxID=2981138 RepID=UPI0024BD0523|nr:methyltransferase [Crossiella sp. CA-258035]WHT23130.1 methyltransferase [Crossiella sp. CA-258035]
MTVSTVVQLLKGAAVTQVVGVAARLGVPDALGPQPRPAAEIGAACGLPAEQAVRLLRAMADLGLCAEHDRGFTATEDGNLLRSDVDGSLHAYALLASHPTALEPLARLEFSLRTGRAAFPEVFGRGVFEHFAADPELAALYNTAMGQPTRHIAESLPARYDFGRFSSVTDVGGGDGTLLITLLRHFPTLRGLVIDTGAAIPQAARAVRRAGLADRCDTQAGDFFAAVPKGSDLLVLKWILHDWDDEAATRILANCRAALPAHGRVLIVDDVLPERGNPDQPRDPGLKDLSMLVLYGGRERTRAEFERLCADAGLVVTDVVREDGVSLVEAAPV